MPDLLQRHELKEVYGFLDAIQIRCDSFLYSRESPSDDHSVAVKHSTLVHLQKAFGTTHVSNKEVDEILKQVHLNYLGLARELLIVDEDGDPKRGANVRS